MIDSLLTSLLSVLEAHRNRILGQTDSRDLQEAKKRFAQSLSGLIDYRIRLAFEERRKHQSQQMIAAADSIDNTVKSTASTIRSMVALNSAPPPPKSDDLNNPDFMKEWMDVYEQWYNNKREAGVSIK